SAIAARAIGRFAISLLSGDQILFGSVKAISLPSPSILPCESCDHGQVRIVPRIRRVRGTVCRSNLKLDIEIVFTIQGPSILGGENRHPSTRGVELVRVHIRAGAVSNHHSAL